MIWKVTLVFDSKFGFLGGNAKSFKDAWFWMSKNPLQDVMKGGLKKEVN
jgi:hypothetical protein